MNIIGLYVCVWLIGEFSTSDVSVLCFIIWKVLILLFKKKYGEIIFDQQKSCKDREFSYTLHSASL